MENEKRKVTANSGPLETTLLVAGLCRLAEILPMPNQQELTEQKLEAYQWALSDISLEPLEWALKRCAKECEFFPSAFEIRERAKDWQPTAERLEDRRRVDITRQAVIEGHTEPKQIVGISEEEARQRLKEVLPRERLIALGLEDPAPVDVEGRLETLRLQAMQLKNDLVH